MDKIALITDSSCDLSKDLIIENNINIIPLRICYSYGEFRDGFDITADEVYNNFHKEIPTTSMPSPGDFIETINKVKSEGYTHCIVVSISEGLSGTYSMLKSISSEIEDIKIHIIDSKLLSKALGVVTLEAARLIKMGHSFESIIEKLDEFKSQTKVFFTVGTLEYLKKGGRIGKVAATLGEVLNLKPIITIGEDGKYYTYSKARGTKNALEKLIVPLEDFCKTTKANVSILEAMAENESKFLYNKIKNLPNINSICITKITPSLAIHTGPGSVGVVFSPAR